MPGVERQSVDVLVETAKHAEKLGIPALALFPYIDASLKTKDAREAYNPDNVVCRATKAIKDACPNLGVITDVALDPFNADGQDRIVINGEILNDETTEALVRQALVQAQAGCDVVAPSDMMDGRIGAIRDVLESEGLKRSRLWPMRQSTPRPSMARSAMQSDRLLPWARRTRKPTSLTPPIAAKRCAKSPMIWKKVLTPSS